MGRRVQETGEYHASVSDFEGNKGERLEAGEIVALPYKWGASIKLSGKRTLSICRRGVGGDKFFIRDDRERRITPVKVKVLGEGEDFTGLRPDDWTNIGRSEQSGNDLIIEDDEVSRKHCQIAVVIDSSGNPFVYIRDLDSSNGTFIDYAKPKEMEKSERFDIGYGSYKGLRRKQEDSYACLYPKDPELLASKGIFVVVADGMGGHLAGRLASSLTVGNTKEEYYSDPYEEDQKEALERAVASANLKVYDAVRHYPRTARPGSTVVAAVIKEGKVYIANVGDSRAYIIRENGSIKQITADHTWVQEQLSAGRINEENDRDWTMMNLITRSIGSHPSVKVDIFDVYMRDGDSLLLCSDGLSGSLTDQEIERIVRDSKSST